MFIICCMTPAVAQQTLTFTGQDNNGTYVQLHHVVIEDVSQGWADTLFYPDTVLFLSGVGLPNYGEEAVFSVSQNTPNPFSGATDFTMRMPYPDRVIIGVFDLSGRKITDLVRQCEAGVHTFRVWLNSPQQYVLMVRTSRETASIKMLNTGNGGRNHIIYIGGGDCLKVNRSETHPFEEGDLMRVVGFRQSDNLFQSSDTVEITSISLEPILLVFKEEEHLSFVRHFVDTNTLFIPDGVECNGSCFGTMNIRVSGYAPDAVLQSIEQLPYVRLKIEHSYLADLWIQLKCPNEQTATILNKHNSGSSGCSSQIPAADWGWNESGSLNARLGHYYKPDGYPACDPAANPMGAGWNYCWSNDTMMGQTYACGAAHVYEDCNHVNTTNPFYPDGQNCVDSTDVATLTNVYHPDQPFTSLIGCPLNGIWQIRIIDGWTTDNGYAEEAEIAFRTTVTTPVDVPYVITGIPHSITPTTAECDGSVLSEGVSPVIERGICWDTMSNPTLSSSYVSSGAGAGDFSATLSGLEASTIYYYRAYATNAVGTAYGETVQFTSGSYMIPTVTTSEVSDITDSSAIAGGSVVDDGGQPVIEQGLCWGVTPTPTIADSHIAASSTTGSFSCVMTGLASATQYYVRAYATNSIGTAYGAVVSFTTNAGLAVVSLDSITMIGSSYATCHGTLVSDGGDPATTVGLCWTSSPNPTIADNHIEWSGEEGTFSRTIGGIHDSVCYVRPYATNVAGTVYGNTLIFSPDTMPTSVQVSLVHLDHNYATMRVTIVCDSTANIANRGLCMDTLPQPDTSDVDISASGTSNTFDIHVGNLERATIYYFRGHCLFNGALLYSDDFVLLTVAEDGQPCVGTPTLTDYEGHVYNTVQVGSQCWMRTNLYTTHFFDGTAIPNGNVGAGSYSDYLPYYYYLTYNTNQILTYGYAYNWKALTKNSTTTNVNAQGICPDGWHIPDDTEWGVLRSYTGNYYGCGDDTTSVAKSLADVSGWNNSTANCSPGAYPSNNNLTGFSAFPSGGHYNSTFQSGEVAYFWSRSNHYTFDTSPYYSYAHVFKISYNSQNLSQTSYSYSRAFAVRCVRDF